MTSRKTLVTTVTVTMTTTTSPPLRGEIDNGNDSQGSPNNAQTAFQRHFVYDPQPVNPKWPLEMRIQDGEHGSLRWLARSADEELDHCDRQGGPSRRLSEENLYNQDNNSKWLPGGHILSNNNNNIGGSRITSSGNSSSMNFVGNIGGNTNCNYYNTSYIKDSGPLSRDQFVDHHFIGSLSPPPPSSSSSPLLMMARENREGQEVKELNDVSGKELRGLKYPPPRRDSDGHILGSANYSAPSPPERDLTLPYPLTSSETLAWKKEKKLSPLPCEPLKDPHAWKEVFDLDPYSNTPYMPTNPTLSTTATNTHVCREDAEVKSEKHSLPTSGYISKEVVEPLTNERVSKTLGNHATNRSYIVKPKPFYNTSTQTEETEVGYDSQLQFKVEENSCTSSRIASMHPNLGFKSDQTYLEKATQVQLPKPSFVDSGLVTLEQLRSPNHQEFIPASAPLLRRLTEEYYQMNINDQDNNDKHAVNINHPHQQSTDIDEHVMDINKFDLHIKKKGTNNASQDHQPFMNINKLDLKSNKTINTINEPLEPCMDKIGISNIDESLMNVNEKMQAYINNFNETDTNTYEYKINVNECHSKPFVVNKKQSFHVKKPQPQFTTDVTVDAIISEPGLSVDEPNLQPFVGIKKGSLNIIEKNNLQPQPQSYKDGPMDIQNLSPSQPKNCKNIKTSFTIKENQLRSFRGGTNSNEPDYMNINEQLMDCNMQRKLDTADDVFEEVKGLPKQIRGDPRLGKQKQGGLLGMAEIPDPFKFQPIRVNSENLKPRTVSAPEKLTQKTEGNFVNSEIRLGPNPENVFRQKDKDNSQTTVNQDANSRSHKDRYRLNHDSFLKHTKENVFSQSTETDCRKAEFKPGTKSENLSDLTRETNSPSLLKKYASTSDIMFSQTAGKNQPINSRNSGRRYENSFNQARENIFMQKTISESLVNRYSSSSEKVGNQSKLTPNILSVRPGLISNYPQTQFGSVSDVLNTPYIAHHETQAAKPDSLTETSKLTAEIEKSSKYPKQGRNTTRSPSMEKTFGTCDDTQKAFENQGLIQHGRSESLPVDCTYESPSLKLRSYYSCTDVNKGKPSESTSIYGVSDYMDMSGRHQKEWSQICSSETDDTRDPDRYENSKKKRSSSCTSYRIHANFEPEEDPPPQLPPRAYRNMPENSTGNLNWIYESLRHRRSYANELRKQARRLNIYKPMANITESHVTDNNEVFVDKETVDITNIYAVEKDRRKDKQKIPNGNSIKDEASKTLNNKGDMNAIQIHNLDAKGDMNIIDTDIDNLTNTDEVSAKSQQLDEVNISNINKHVLIISEHSSTNECSPNINKPASYSTDILGSNVSPPASYSTDIVSSNVSQPASYSTDILGSNISQPASYSTDIFGSNVSQPASYSTDIVSSNVSQPALYSTDIVSSNVSQKSHNINELNEQSQSNINKKGIHIDNTSEEYKDFAAHTIKHSIKSVIGVKETDIDADVDIDVSNDVTNVSVRTLDNILQNERSLNNSFEPNMHINEQESHLTSEDFIINEANQMYLNEHCNIINNDINDSTKIDENVNFQKCVLHINENSANIYKEDHPIRREIVQQVSPLSDLSKARRTPQSTHSPYMTSPTDKPELLTPSPTLEHSIFKMPSPEPSSNKVQFPYRSSSEQCLTSIGSCDGQMKLPLYVSLVNIPTEEGFISAADKQRNLVSVKQRIHFFEYDSNGHLVGNRIPPPVPAKPTSLVLRKKFPKEEGFSPTEPSPETDIPTDLPMDLPTDPSILDFLIEKQPEEYSVDIADADADDDEEEEEVSNQEECYRSEHVQYNIKENMGIDADKASLLLLPEAEEVTSTLEYFQQPQLFKEDPIDKEHLIRKKVRENALRESLRRKLDVLREAKMNVEAEIQEIDTMKKNICSRFENVCPNNNERRKLIDFFKDREMCQVLLSKLKVRITRLENEMVETRPSHDLNDKLSKLRIQYSEAEQLSSDIDGRQNSLVRLLEKYLTETNLSDFNYLLMMRPRLVGEMFELNEKIYSGGQKLLELERVPYK